MAKIIAFEDKSDVNESYRLTVEQIRSFPDFINFSDEEIIEIRDTLYEFCLIVYEYISRDQSNIPQKQTSAEFLISKKQK